MLLTYSLKTGLTPHETKAASSHHAPCQQDVEIMPHEVNSSPFDCWARMIPRQLEDGVPSVPAPAVPPSPRRRSRPQYRVLYPSSHSQSQQQPAEPSSPPPAAPKGRGVRFAPKDTVHPVPSRSDYTPEERASTWHTRRDLLRIKSEAGLVVNAMRRGEYIDEYSSPHVTTRGLERHASEAHGAARRERKCAVVAAVLEEQARQREAGGKFPRPCELRMASVHVSWRSRDAARAAAEWDEYVVRCENHYGAGYGAPEVTTAATWPVRVVSQDDMEEDEPRRPQTPPSPKRRHKRTVSDVYFSNYDVLDEGAASDENTPPPSHYNYQQQYHAQPTSCDYWYAEQQYHNSQPYSSQHCAEYVTVDRYQPLTEVRAKRSIVCR